MCNKHVHHLCQIEWAFANGVSEVDSILKVCREHCSEYNKIMRQNQMPNNTLATVQMATATVDNPLPAPTIPA
jgi:hypothetical protein